MYDGVILDQHTGVCRYSAKKPGGIPYDSNTVDLAPTHLKVVSEDFDKRGRFAARPDPQETARYRHLIHDFRHCTPLRLCFAKTISWSSRPSQTGDRVGSSNTSASRTVLNEPCSRLRTFHGAKDGSTPRCHQKDGRRLSARNKSHKDGGPRRAGGVDGLAPRPRPPRLQMCRHDQAGTPSPGSGAVLPGPHHGHPDVVWTESLLRGQATHPRWCSRESDLVGDVLPPRRARSRRLDELASAVRLRRMRPPCNGQHLAYNLGILLESAQ